MNLLKKILIILVFTILCSFCLNILLKNEVQAEQILRDSSEGTSTPSSASTIDDIMSGADKFISSGESSSDINEKELKSASDFLYNLFLGIGMIVAVAVGVVLGIKYMLGSVEEKASLKETLLAYLIGCVVVFGAFGIWKIAVNILQAM